MKSLLLLLSLFAVDSTAVLGREDIISAVMSSTYKNRAASNCIDGERTMGSGASAITIRSDQLCQTDILGPVPYGPDTPDTVCNVGLPDMRGFQPCGSRNPWIQLKVTPGKKITSIFFFNPAAGPGYFRLAGGLKVFVSNESYSDRLSRGAMPPDAFLCFDNCREYDECRRANVVLGGVLQEGVYPGQCETTRGEYVTITLLSDDENEFRIINLEEINIVYETKELWPPPPSPARPREIAAGESIDPLFTHLAVQRSRPPPAVSSPPPPSPKPPMSMTRTSSGGLDGGGHQDPHLHFAHGGSADFRGHDGIIYAFLSAPNLAVNVKTEDSSFLLNGGKLKVNGSFLTEVHVVARVGGAKRKWAMASFWASELNGQNWGWKIVNGTCGGQRFILGRKSARQCEELSIRTQSSHAVFALRNWTVTVRGNHVYQRLSGPAHRLDVSFRAEGDAAARCLPHGIVGQSFSSPKERVGRLDEYPEEGQITTRAMAEGAIDGEADMYELPSVYATAFTFSRFEGALETARLNAALLTRSNTVSVTDGDADD